MHTHVGRTHYQGMHRKCLSKHPVQHPLLQTALHNILCMGMHQLQAFIFHTKIYWQAYHGYASEHNSMGMQQMQPPRFMREENLVTASTEASSERPYWGRPNQDFCFGSRAFQWDERGGLKGASSTLALVHWCKAPLTIARWWIHGTGTLVDGTMALLCSCISIRWDLVLGAFSSLQFTAVSSTTFDAFMLLGALRALTLDSLDIFWCFCAFREVWGPFVLPH